MFFHNNQKEMFLGCWDCCCACSSYFHFVFWAFFCPYVRCLFAGSWRQRSIRMYTCRLRFFLLFIFIFFFVEIYFKNKWKKSRQIDTSVFLLRPCLDLQCNQSVLCGPCAGHHTCLLLEERMNSSWFIRFSFSFFSFLFSLSVFGYDRVSQWRRAKTWRRLTFLATPIRPWIFYAPNR